MSKKQIKHISHISEAAHAFTSSAFEEGQSFDCLRTRPSIELNRFSKTFLYRQSQYRTTGVKPVASEIKSPCNELRLSLCRPPQHAVHFNLAVLAQRWCNCLYMSCLNVHHSFFFCLFVFFSTLCVAVVFYIICHSLPFSPPSFSIVVCLGLLACTDTPFITMPGTSDCSILSFSGSGKDQATTDPLIRWIENLL